MAGPDPLRAVVPEYKEEKDEDENDNDDYYFDAHWTSGLRRVSTADHLLGLRVRIPPAAWMFVCCECCVFVR